MRNMHCFELDPNQNDVSVVYRSPVRQQDVPRDPDTGPKVIGE